MSVQIDKATINVAFLSINNILYILEVTKMAIFDVVRFEGTGSDWLIYKHPGTEFNTRSKLIVSPGQVAIIVH